MIPLYLPEHPVGLLFVEESNELVQEQESTLMTVANQAALALGTTILCIDRARRLAVETERNRIARDIHDTVAQSLFGIVYSLDACINMLPTQAEEVRKELIELRSLASGAHDEVRRSIFDLWPSPLTIELFMADLTSYVSSCCRPHSFNIIFNHNGDFDSLSPGLRRTIYRMAQEALANSARHSGVNSARLCMSITAEEIYLDISDNGRGFDPLEALSRSQNREHFGLLGMQERLVWWLCTTWPGVSAWRWVQRGAEKRIGWRDQAGDLDRRMLIDNVIDNMHNLNELQAMILRDAEAPLRSLLQGFPVITITGPRQSGKTTLAKAIFSNKPYLSLEDPDVRRMALDDPRAFLGHLPDGAVLDEVQRAPELLSYLQTRVDADGRMGLFLLTGSQQFGLMSGVAQSLAGRTAFIELLPFSVHELEPVGARPLSLDAMLFTGSPRYWTAERVPAGRSL